MPFTSTQTTLMRAALLLATTLACGTPADTTTATSSSSDTGAETTQGAAASSSTGEPPTTGATTSISDTTGEPTTGSTGESDSTGEPLTGTASTDTTTGTTTGDTTDTTGATTGTTDEAGSTGSTGSTDSTEPDGLGVIAGECGLIDAMELESPAPFVFSNAIDFGVVGLDEALLTPGGQQIKAEGGLNDGSLASEIVAYEVLARCDMALLLKTEGKIVYNDPMGKKTDLLVELDGLKVGVSVVRAVGFPQEDPYSVAQAETILKKKLADIAVSSDNVAPEDAWVKQILSVVAYGPMHVESILTAYAGLDPALKADTILVVSVTDGDDAFLY